MSAALLEPAESEASVLAGRSPRRTESTWLQALSHLDRRYGGLTAVVPALCAQLQQREHLSTKLAAFCAPDEDLPVTQAQSVPTSIWPAGHAKWLTGRRLRHELGEAVRAVDGVHIHGLWDASMILSARAARQQRKPYIVSAHGMLEPWALAQKAAKKRLYGALIERPAMQHAACLHALTLAEADNYRGFGCTRPIAVIPNAVEAPKVIDGDLIEEMFPEVTGRRVVLFLGRLHVKKGIELLLQAWVRLVAEQPDAVLMLAGPGESAYVGALRTRAAELGVTNQVVFAGMLNEKTKWSALRRAHVFVLPSYSEGLSVAALESLCIGTPVIVTEACHLPEVVSADCGWQIPTDAGAVEQALRESLESSQSMAATRSRNARELAAARFSWGVVCEQMAELYACVLHGGTPKLSVYKEGRA